MYIKHSKYKNTSILFEILVRKITADTLAGKESPAINTLKKYFVNTEIGKEYKLCEMVFKSKSVDNNKENAILSTVLESSKNLNRTKLKREKYNLIREIKENYDIDRLFKTKINDYKAQASLYTLFEITNTEKAIDPNQIIDNKVTLLEHLTKSEVNKENIKKDIIEEYKSYDKDLRILTYKILLERFNDKYSNLSLKQKQILKEFINAVDSSSNLKEFYNNEIKIIREDVIQHLRSTKDEVTKIKLREVKKLIKEVNKRQTIKSDHLVDLLQYHSLVDELDKVNG